MRTHARVHFLVALTILAQPKHLRPPRGTPKSFFLVEPGRQEVRGNPWVVLLEADAERHERRRHTVFVG
eukprot:12378784-Prorocentrum_lima.AAC.1